jgi:hypothetical protein
MPAKKLYDLPVEVLADIVSRAMGFDPNSPPSRYPQKFVRLRDGSERTQPLNAYINTFLVSRKFFQIATPILYSRAFFSCSDSRIFRSFIDRISPDFLKRLRYLKLYLTVRDDLPGATEQTQLELWTDAIALLPTSLRVLRISVAELPFFSNRGTHPLLLHAVHRLSGLDELEVVNLPGWMHFDLFCSALPYFDRYNPKFMQSSAYAGPLFPSLRTLNLEGSFARNPGYLTAALSAKNLPRIDSLLINLTLPCPCCGTGEVFSPEALRQIRPLTRFAWRTSDVERLDTPAHVHKHLTKAHLAVLADRHGNTLRKLELDLTRLEFDAGSFSVGDILDFLKQLSQLQSLTLYLPRPAISLLGLIANSENSVLPSLRKLDLSIICKENHVRCKKKALLLPLSPFASRLEELLLTFVIGDPELPYTRLETLENRMQDRVNKGRPARNAGKRVPEWCTINLLPWCEENEGDPVYYFDEIPFGVST